MTMHVRFKTLLLLVSLLPLLVVAAAYIDTLNEGHQVKLKANEEVSHDD
jgi:hypothetical protein